MNMKQYYEFTLSDNEMTRSFSHNGKRIRQVSWMQNQGAYLIEYHNRTLVGALPDEEVVEEVSQVVKLGKTLEGFILGGYKLNTALNKGDS